MTAIITDEIRDELEQIRAKHPDGLLKTSDVIKQAKKKRSAIREWFDAHGGFDDKVAAEKYREILATQLIVRVHVLIPAGSGQEITVRAYHSLASDRQSGGGYRAVVETLSDEDRKAEMLMMAFSDIQSLLNKYRELSALDPIFNKLEGLLSQSQSSVQQTSKPS